MIKDRLAQPVDLEKGRQGQFDVLVDGRPVVSRKGGLLAMITGRPWPTDDEVLEAVRGAMQKPSP